LNPLKGMARGGDLMTFARRPPWPGLGDLLEGDAYRFRFALRPGRAGWLGSGDGDEDTLHRRRALLDDVGTLPWTPAADAAWERVEASLEPALRWRGQGHRSAIDRARRVSGGWAPDFVLLRWMGDAWRMVGGAVCFPSGWDPMEKLGGTVADIHGPVPTLNEDLGARMDRFLGGLREGDAFERDNWGMAATGELDLHPRRGMPRITGRETAGELWFRLEEQAFLGLGDGMILFLIHVRTWRLDEFLDATGCREGLCRMLASMTPEVAAYKGLSGLRARILDGTGPWSGP
jgi:hypothetical protein